MRTLAGAGIAIGVAFAVLGACASFGSTTDDAPDAGGDAASEGAAFDAGADAPIDALPGACTPAPPPMPCADDAGTVCPDGCQDLTSSSRNCGGCGRVCDGSCVGGACVAQLIGSAPGANVRIGAVNTTHVYFRGQDGTGIYRVPVNGGAVAPNPFYTNDGGVLDVAADDDSVFVLTPDSVVRAALASGNLQTIHFASADSGGRITATVDRVFWTDGTTGGGVHVAARDGTMYSDLASALTHAPIDVGVTQNEVVFLEQAGNAMADGVIASADANVAGSAMPRIGGLMRGDLVVNGDDVVYTTSDTVWLASRIDFTHVAIATVFSAEHVAADDAWIYFSGTLVNGGPYSIWRVSRCGGPIAPMVSGDFGGNLTSLRVGGDHLYWHGQDTGVYRVAK